MKKIKPEEFLELIDDRWKYITMGDDGLVGLWERKPKNDRYGWCAFDDYDYGFIEIRNVGLGLKIDWPSDDWRECIVEREPDIEELMGKIVVAGAGSIGKLREYEAGKDFPYAVDLLSSGLTLNYKSVRPLTKEEKEMLA